MQSHLLLEAFPATRLSTGWETLGPHIYHLILTAITLALPPMAPVLQHRASIHYEFNELEYAAYMALRADKASSHAIH